jgi:hypothetical protein
MQLRRTEAKGYNTQCGAQLPRIATVGCPGPNFLGTCPEMSQRQSDVFTVEMHVWLHRGRLAGPNHHGSHGLCYIHFRSPPTPMLFPRPQTHDETYEAGQDKVTKCM